VLEPNTVWAQPGRRHLLQHRAQSEVNIARSRSPSHHETFEAHQIGGAIRPIWLTAHALAAGRVRDREQHRDDPGSDSCYFNQQA
jgi:hypothetical protein